MRATAEFSRPADTTAYAAEDAVSDSTSAPTVLTFKGLGYAANRAGGLIEITQAKILTNQASNTARFLLHLYHTAPVPLNDNAPFTGPLYADRDSYIGSILLGGLNSEGTGATAAYAENNSPDLTFTRIDGRRDIYGLLETLDVFTPASGQGFFIELQAEGIHV